MFKNVFSRRYIQVDTRIHERWLTHVKRVSSPSKALRLEGFVAVNIYSYKDSKVSVLGE